MAFLLNAPVWPPVHEVPWALRPGDHLTSCSHARGPQKELAGVKSRQLQQVSEISTQCVPSLSFVLIALIPDQRTFVAGHQKRVLFSFIKPVNNSKL